MTGTGTITSVTFSLDGARIYSESENEKRVWNVATRETIPDATWEPPGVATHTASNGRWFVTNESNNIVMVDLEYRITPDEKARRMAKASFDPVWHHEQAKAATTAENWYAAVFHYAWLLKHDPDSLEYYFGLQSSYRRLTARSSADVEAMSRLDDVTGNSNGTFYSQKKKQIVTHLPTTRFESTEESSESPTQASDSNRALYFDGTSYADLGNPPFYKASFTVEGWIKPNAPGASSSKSSSLPYTIFTVRSGEVKTAMAAEVYQDGRLRVIHRNPPAGTGGINLYSQTNVTDDQWHHFAVVRDDDKKLHLYIDGLLEASSKAMAADFGNTPYQVVLGVSVEKAPRYFTGLMDEVRFWSDTRTQEQINRDLNRLIDRKSEGLAAYYDFNRDEEKPNVEKDFETEEHKQFYLSPVVTESLKLRAATSSTID